MDFMKFMSRYYFFICKFDVIFLCSYNIDLEELCMLLYIFV